VLIPEVPPEPICVNVYLGAGMMYTVSLREESRYMAVRTTISGELTVVAVDTGMYPCTAKAPIGDVATGAIKSGREDESWIVPPDGGA